MCDSMGISQHGVCFLIFFFLTTVLSQWDFSQGKFELPSLGKASCDSVALPNLGCMLGVFSVFRIHRTLTWTAGSLMCAQMSMPTMVCGGVWSQESLHRKLTLGEKSLAATGKRTCASSVPLRRSTNLATFPPHT